MNFSKSRLLWYLTRTPGVARGSRPWRFLVTLAVPAAAGFAYFIVESKEKRSVDISSKVRIKKKTKQEKDSSTSSRLRRTVVVVVPVTKHVTIPKEPAQEKDSSTGSRLWRVCVPLLAGAAAAVVAVVVVPAAVAAVGFGVGGVAVGSLAAKGMSLAATNGSGTWGMSSLQSMGAAGLTASKPFMVGSTVTTSTSMIMRSSGNEDKKEK